MAKGEPDVTTETGHMRDHAEHHAAGGRDAVSPEAIGAATQVDLFALSQVEATDVSALNLIVAGKADLPLVDVIEVRVTGLEIALPRKAEQVQVDQIANEVDALVTVPKGALLVHDAIEPVPEGWEQAGQLPPFLLIRKKQTT